MLESDLKQTVLLYLTKPLQNVPLFTNAETCLVPLDNSIMLVCHTVLLSMLYL